MAYARVMGPWAACASVGPRMHVRDGCMLFGWSKGADAVHGWLSGRLWVHVMGGLGPFRSGAGLQYWAADRGGTMCEAALCHQEVTLGGVRRPRTPNLRFGARRGHVALKWVI